MQLSITVEYSAVVYCKTCGGTITIIEVVTGYHPIELVFHMKQQFGSPQL